jgi:bifunctional DNA-binding transcriptional regulator/antitoxin component of YhaV-PrlF toxin-antitoxin module
MRKPMITTSGPIEADAKLRAKNQITVPDAIVRALGASQDDVLAFEADPAQPGVAHVRLMPRDFAGSLTGMWGTTEEVLAFLQEEHDSWGE